MRPYLSGRYHLSEDQSFAEIREYAQKNNMNHNLFISNGFFSEAGSWKSHEETNLKCAPLFHP